MPSDWPCQYNNKQGSTITTPATRQDATHYHPAILISMRRRLDDQSWRVTHSSCDWSKLPLWPLSYSPIDTLTTR
ncbi:hypothetical protein WAI453_011638 [Rhynchosporium graminicola]